MLARNTKMEKKKKEEKGISLATSCCGAAARCQCHLCLAARPGRLKATKAVNGHSHHKQSLALNAIFYQNQ
jgi:hypothetical protein